MVLHHRIKQVNSPHRQEEKSKSAELKIRYCHSRIIYCTQSQTTTEFKRVNSLLPTAPDLYLWPINGCMCLNHSVQRTAEEY